MVDIDKIEQAAEAATPGPWLMNHGYPTMISSKSETWPLVDDGEEVGRTGVFIANTGDSTENGQFIAESDPQTILKLIAVVRAAKATMTVDQDDTVESLAADLTLYAALEALK